MVQTHIRRGIREVIYKRPVERPPFWSYWFTTLWLGACLMFVVTFIAVERAL